METEFGKRGGEWPQLLDLISNGKDWLERDEGGGRGGISLGASEEEKLELTLAPPGGDGWPVMEDKLEKISSVNSSSFFSKKLPKPFPNNTVVATKRLSEPNTEGLQQEQLGFYQVPAIDGFGKESSLDSNGMMVQSHESEVRATTEDGALAKNSSQIRGRATSSRVVGWPPIRSLRKNIAIGSSKPSVESQNAATRGSRLRTETSKKGLFVKINVDGIPIGRKVDLKFYDNYEKLSAAVEDLFCGLLSAQRDLTVSGTGMREGEKMAFTGLLDGSGEYTLVYEDNEGDRMLVGDVPWDLFVSTAKRLRVLKNSELSAFISWNSQQKD